MVTIRCTRIPTHIYNAESLNLEIQTTNYFLAKSDNIQSVRFSCFLPSLCMVVKLPNPMQATWWQLSGRHGRKKEWRSRVRQGHSGTHSARGDSESDRLHTKGRGGGGHRRDSKLGRHCSSSRAHTRGGSQKRFRVSQAL